MYEWLLGFVMGIAVWCLYDWWLHKREVPRINRSTRATAQEHFARWAYEETKNRLSHFIVQYRDEWEALTPAAREEAKHALLWDVICEESNHVNPDDFRGDTSEGTDYGAD